MPKPPRRLAQIDEAKDKPTRMRCNGWNYKDISKIDELDLGQRTFVLLRQLVIDQRVQTRAVLENTAQLRGLRRDITKLRKLLAERQEA